MSMLTSKVKFLTNTNIWDQHPTVALDGPPRFTSESGSVRSQIHQQKQVLQLLDLPTKVGPPSIIQTYNPFLHPWDAPQSRLESMIYLPFSSFADFLVYCILDTNSLRFPISIKDSISSYKLKYSVVLQPKSSWNSQYFKLCFILRYFCIGLGGWSRPVSLI